MSKFTHVVSENIAIACLVVMLLFMGIYFHTQDTLVRTRRQDICHMGEAIIDGLINSTPQSQNPDAQKLQQQKIDDYEKFVENASGTLNCHFHLLPAK